MSLPADWYHDPGIFARERGAVFGREWQLIGPESAFAHPGDYLASEIVGWRVFVIRDREGTLRGFHNVCRHRASPILDDGRGHCETLRCRYHGWVYDTAGALRRLPDFGEVSFDKAAYGLFPIRVETWRGLVFVNLDAAAGPLVPSLGELVELVAPYPIEDFAFVREEVFDIACNWKTYTDNFVEGYHIPGIHAGLNAAIDFKRFSTEGRNRIVIMRAPQRDGSIYGGVWLWCYPNMTLSVFPDGMNTSRIVPVDRRRARLVYNFYFRDASPEAMARHQRTIDVNCAIVREDFGICESAQGNLEAGVFENGPLSPLQERGVRYFHELLRRSLAEDSFALAGSGGPA